MTSRMLLILIAAKLLSLTAARERVLFPTERPYDAPPCRTVTQEEGSCILLENCAVLFDFIKSGRLTDTDKEYLRHSQCGFANGKVMVCCPERYITSSSSAPIFPAPPLAPKTPKIPVAVPPSMLATPELCQKKEAIHNKIFGGDVTEIDESPWMALFGYSKPSGVIGFHCGGALISHRYVLSAAHCVSESTFPSGWHLKSVRLGEWDLQTNPDCMAVGLGEACAPPFQEVAVDRTLQHPDYIANPSQPNDIALVRLARPVLFTNYIRPLCLPRAEHLRQARFENVELEVAGWGATEANKTSPVKLKVALNGVNLRSCQNVYRTLQIQLMDTQFCAGGKQGIDSCRGDSGGPMVGTDRLNDSWDYFFIAGIVSFGPSECGLKGWPGVYTRVGPYVEWIEQNVDE